MKQDERKADRNGASPKGTGSKDAGSKGAEGFDAHYRALWGEEWDRLKDALRTERWGMEWTEGLLRPYFLDPCSAIAARCLSLASARPASADAGDAERLSVLDLCAAPGGKSLVLASRLAASGMDWDLVCNELSAERSGRLSRVLDEHLPAETRERVRVMTGDGAKLCLRRRESFDAILVDAPCSSERHVLEQKKHLDAWTPSRAKEIPFRQWALLSSAFLMLKPGGELLYSTCSISRAENEDMIERLFKKYGSAVLEREPLEVFHESGVRPGAFTESVDLVALASSSRRLGRGAIFLPHLSGGYGPLFVARIRKEP